jgi:hypothetical protein
MSIEMENPETLLGKMDAALNLVEQIGLALSVGDIAHAKEAKEKASRLLMWAIGVATDAEYSGIGVIAAERDRQLKIEGWTAEHDDRHVEGELAVAGAVYAMAVPCLIAGTPPAEIKQQILEEGCETIWPWDPEWLKIPDDPIRCLAKAGACFGAEIDRLQRANQNLPTHFNNEETERVLRESGGSVASEEDAVMRAIRTCPDTAQVRPMVYGGHEIVDGEKQLGTGVTAVAAWLDAGAAMSPENGPILPLAAGGPSSETAHATRKFEIRNTLIGYCGQSLTRDNVDKIAVEMLEQIENGSCAWAFKHDADPGRVADRDLNPSMTYAEELAALEKRLIKALVGTRFTYEKGVELCQHIMSYASLSHEDERRRLKASNAEAALPVTAATQIEKQYAYSTDEESEVFHGRFDSREEASADAFKDPAMNCVWIGEIVDPIQPEDHVDADLLLEHVACQDDYEGEIADQWPESSKEQEEELTGEIRKTFAGWLDRHELRPTHYVIERDSIQKVERGAAPVGGYPCRECGAMGVEIPNTICPICGGE